MPTTYKASEVATALKDFIDAHKVELGIKAVYYGDQSTFPTTPCVCVEPATKIRELTGMPLQTTNTMTISIIVYHTSLQGTEVIQEECDVITENLEDLINTETMDATNLGLPGTRLNGRITHGMITRSENGYRILANKLMRANRLVWEGMSKTRLVDP